jgi:enhanced filamentous growth protein 1
MPNTHYTAQPATYDAYPPPPQHQSPYGMAHFTHSPHPPSPYGHHFPSEYHHDPFQYSGGFRNYVTDPSGQSGPPGMKPRVTTTLWEDENTLCFQVEAKGICVARREGTPPFLRGIAFLAHALIEVLVEWSNMIDNDMINGTKLLNVAGMSRGKRDGILKSEKQRNVVKVGAMHLKGVWYALS